jgi:RNA recognition motif-containing protein
MDTAEACKGLACVVFERREHAEKAVDELNASTFGGRSLRVDWAYPIMLKPCMRLIESFSLQSVLRTIRRFSLRSIRECVIFI